MFRKTALDKDLKRLNRLEQYLQETSEGMLPYAIALTFLVLAGLAAFSMTGMAPGWAIIVGATVVGGYMALNIGANDVANNMAPAVGSRALKIGVAVLIAAVFEAAGALIAGADVVSTVSKGIIDPDLIPNTNDFVTGMLAALFAAALWINIATAVGAPVSTTHSIVGGVLGGGIAMAGFGVADWGVVSKIVASWVISPVMGGVVAALLLAYIEYTIMSADDRRQQAERRVPSLVGFMGGAFAAYLLVKVMERFWAVPLWLAVIFGVIVLIITTPLIRPLISRKLAELDERKQSVGELFTIPVIAGACLLSFAHGSNDVANAIGPLAAIYTSVSEGELATRAAVPSWVLVVGALGISTGLLLFGPKLIRTVGSQITKLNRVRAFCVTVSAAITVIIASSLGLPISSTHTAIGALFGVGFLREFLANRDAMRALPLRPPNPETDPDVDAEQVSAQTVAKARKRYLVRRYHVVTIVGAWIITVPATALMAGLLALAIRALDIVQF